MPDDALTDASDTELMVLLAQGDRSALAELVRRHQSRVLQIAYRTTGDRSLAEDIGQETFLRVWRSAGRYRPTALFSTWLYRIVVNLCLDARKKKTPIVATVPETIPASQPGVSNRLDTGERARRIRSAVTDLPERQRVAVVLHRFSGLPQRQVADVTGWTESAVESLLVRAYATLRESLRDLPQSQKSTQES